MHLYRLGLPDAVGAVGGLGLHCRVPPAVEVHHVARPGEVEPRTGRFQRQQEDRGLARLEPVHHGLALGDRRTTVQELGAYPACRQMLFEQPRHLYVLGEHEHARVLRENGVEQLVEELQLPRTVRDPWPLLLEVLRGVVADLLQRRQQFHHQAAPGEPVGAGDLGQGLPYHRLVQPGLLRSQ